MEVVQISEVLQVTDQFFEFFMSPALISFRQTSYFVDGYISKILAYLSTYRSPYEEISLFLYLYSNNKELSTAFASFFWAIITIERLSTPPYCLSSCCYAWNYDTTGAFCFNDLNVFLFQVTTGLIGSDDIYSEGFTQLQVYFYPLFLAKFGLAGLCISLCTSTSGRSSNSSSSISQSKSSDENSSSRTISFSTFFGGDSACLGLDLEPEFALRFGFLQVGPRWNGCFFIPMKGLCGRAILAIFGACNLAFVPPTPIGQDQNFFVGFMGPIFCLFFCICGYFGYFDYFCQG